MKRVLLIIICIAVNLISFSSIKVDSIITFLNSMSEAEKNGLIKINYIFFEREDNIIKGYIDFNLIKAEELKAFLSNSGFNNIEFNIGNNRLYVREDKRNYLDNEFKTIFISKFTEILSSKNFYFISLIILIFYLLILPYI